MTFVIAHLRRLRLNEAWIALWRDERGLTAVEYCTAGGVLSGLIVWGAHAMRAAQDAAIQRMIAPGG